MTRASELRASPLALPSALADTALVALRQSMSLNAALMRDCLGLGWEQSRRAAVDPMGALRDAMLSPALAEPIWRWANGLAALGPQAAMSWAAAVSPQQARLAAAFGWPVPAEVADAANGTERTAGDAAQAMLRALTESASAAAVAPAQALMRAFTEATSAAAVAPAQAVLKAIDDADGERIDAAAADDRSARPVHAYAAHAPVAADGGRARRAVRAATTSAPVARGAARTPRSGAKAKASTSARTSRPAAGGTRRPAASKRR